MATASVVAGQDLLQPDLADTLRCHRERRAERILPGPSRRQNRHRRAQGRRHHDHRRSGKLSRRSCARRCAARYRGYDIVSMPPPSSGGVHLIEMLNILEGYDLGKLSREQSLHDMIEAMKRAYADRAVFMGDPDAVKMPVAGLFSKAYATSLRAEIGERATPSADIRAGKACRFRRPQHHAFLGDRSRRQRRVEYLHAEFLVWPRPRCRGHRRTAQQ